jgi:tetratricopeptide (TPR) repeat protein
MASVAMVFIALLAAGLVLRDQALDRADWARRVDKLRQSVPNTLAMLSSLTLAPEIEPDVVADLERSFEWIADKAASTGNGQLDPRWNNSSPPVDDELRVAWNETLQLASNHPWKAPPSFLGKLQGKSELDSIPFTHPIHLVQQRHWHDAASELSQRVKEHPKDYVAWWLLGDCYSYLEEHSHAIQAYTACIAIQPKVAIAYFNRGRSRFLLSEFDAAAEDYFQVSQKSPRWQWARLNRALALQHANRLKEAVSECDAAIEHGYATVSVYRLRGELHAALGELEKSRLDMALALECTPITDQHWMDRGLIRLESNPEDAKQDFARALELNPVSIDAHQKLAYVYSELLQQPETSLVHLAELIKLAPNQPTHLAGRAVVHARNGRGNEAAADLALLERKEIRDGMVCYQIACAYSLLAANSHGTMSEPGPSENGRHAFRWYLRAVDADSSFAAISLSDPDVQWMREQAKFQEIQNAIQTLQASASNGSAAP